MLTDQKLKADQLCKARDRLFLVLPEEVRQQTVEGKLLELPITLGEKPLDLLRRHLVPKQDPPP